VSSALELRALSNDVNARAGATEIVAHDAYARMTMVVKPALLAAWTAK
jgi:hypothetical protein